MILSKDEKRTLIDMFKTMSMMKRIICVVKHELFVSKKNTFEISYKVIDFFFLQFDLTKLSARENSYTKVSDKSAYIKNKK